MAETGPIDRAEMFEMFGSETPSAAFDIMCEADDTMTLGEARDRLRKMAAPMSRRLARRVIRVACMDANLWLGEDRPPPAQLLRLEEMINTAIEIAVANATGETTVIVDSNKATDHG